MVLRVSSMTNRQFFIAALGIAVILRLLLMPFFAHVDLFSEYRRVFYALENGLFTDNSHRFVTYWIEMLFSALSLLFINVTEGLFHLEDPARSTSNLTDYAFFLNDPNVFRHLFFFKLPYLLFDIATAVIIWRFIDNPSHKRIALLLWLFNPLTLFATYIFGRFEVISLFFLALTAYQLKFDRRLLAAVCLGLALHCREINIIFLPYFLIAIIDFKDHWVRNIIMIVSSAAIILGIYVLPDSLLTALGGNVHLYTNPDAAYGNDSFKKLLSLGYYWFYPVVIGLAGLALFGWENGNRSHAERFIIMCACVLFVYFSFNVHSIHYASWLVLFPILCTQFERRVVFPFVLLFGAWLVLWLLKTDNGVFTLFLAGPLNPDLMGLGHFPTWFNRNLATQEFGLHQTIQVMRSLFLVVLAFFFYRVLKRAD